MRGYSLILIVEALRLMLVVLLKQAAQD